MRYSVNSNPRLGHRFKQCCLRAWRCPVDLVRQYELCEHWPLTKRDGTTGGTYRMQNQPNPATPVHERRWLDRLRAAWDEARARPKSTTKAGALDAVARERPREARYRIDTFAADAARRTSSAPATPGEEPPSAHDVTRR